MININDKIAEIEKILDEHDMFAEEYGADDSMFFTYVDFRINWGDWKHNHLAFNWLVEENVSDVYKIVEFDYEDDGSDCYCSTHRVYFTEDKELLDRMSVLFM